MLGSELPGSREPRGVGCRSQDGSEAGGEFDGEQGGIGDCRLTQDTNAGLRGSAYCGSHFPAPRQSKLPERFPEVGEVVTCTGAFTQNVIFYFFLSRQN